MWSTLHSTPKVVKRGFEWMTDLPANSIKPIRSPLSEWQKNSLGNCLKVSLLHLFCQIPQFYQLIPTSELYFSQLDCLIGLIIPQKRATFSIFNTLLPAFCLNRCFVLSSTCWEGKAVLKSWKSGCHRSARGALGDITKWLHPELHVFYVHFLKSGTSKSSLFPAEFLG